MKKQQHPSLFETTKEEETATDWRRGQSDAEIKRVAKFFAAFEDDITHGSMASVSKPTVAEWLSEAMLCETRHTMFAVKTLDKQQVVKDFSRVARFVLLAGNKIVKRVATTDVDDAIKQLQKLDGAVFFELFEEKREHQQIAKALKLTWLCTKIRSTAELVGIYANFKARLLDDNPLDLLGLEQLKLQPFDVSKAARALEDVTEFTDHYSKYNKASAWSALALRSYGGDAAFIVKPSEMKQSWRRENPDALKLTLKDTALRAKLRVFEEMIAAVPGVKHRIRLMKLAPSGGELERHTDNCDPDCGTREGELLRIHIPIVTNDKVEFTSWSLRGVEQRERMRAGETWYLDTRKPHRAVNAGTTDRIHLVMDIESNAALRSLLGGRAQ